MQRRCFYANASQNIKNVSINSQTPQQNHHERKRIMKNVLAMCLTLTIGGTAFGLDHHNLQPVPAVPGYGNGVAIELFNRVKYKDYDEMAPCAVTKIIQVKDPCACRDACNCCGPKCVSIRICVPPCACERVKVSRNGNRIKYDYGEYEVDVRVKKGYIEVDYQD